MTGFESYNGINTNSIKRKKTINHKEKRNSVNENERKFCRNRNKERDIGKVNLKKEKSLEAQSGKWG